MVDAQEADRRAFEADGLAAAPILARAFDSQIVPQDPTDESAEKLLKRIKAHR
jgi:hypothetical protein